MRVSEEKFRNVLENSLDVICRLNVDTGTYEYVSPISEELFGYSPDDLMAKGFEGCLSIIHRDDVSEIEHLFKKAKEKIPGVQRISPIEYRIKHPPLGYRWMSDTWAIVTDAQKENYAIVGCSRDITQTKNAEESLKESEEKFRTLAEESPNMIFINKNGRVVYVNKLCEHILGYKRAAFYSEAFGFVTIVAPEYRKVRMKRNFIHGMDEKDTLREIAFVTRDGERIEALMTTKMIAYEGECAVLGIITDINESHHQCRTGNIR